MQYICIQISPFLERQLWYNEAQESGLISRTTMWDVREGIITEDITDSKAQNSVKSQFK